MLHEFVSNHSKARANRLPRSCPKFNRLKTNLGFLRYESVFHFVLRRNAANLTVWTQLAYPFNWRTANVLLFYC